MNINWTITEFDIQRVKDFVNDHQNPFVESRISRNVNRLNIQVDRNSILKGIIMCLLTTQQRSGPNTPIGNFLRLNPFPLTTETLTAKNDTENFVKQTLLQNGLNRYINRIPKFFAANYTYLVSTNWQLFNNLEITLNGQVEQEIEREIADIIATTLKGFGPKQARNFLQALGLTKFEIPIDSRITNWLNDFGFPVTLSPTALQDTGYYHFVSDGIQELCKRANIFPCILDAAIFSSFDNGQWNQENIVY